MPPNARGDYLIAHESTNEAGWPVYQFSGLPYVHHSEKGAENEARRLARKQETSFAVFKKVCSVTCEPAEAVTSPLNLDDLAGTLARKLQESDRFLSIESCRALVDAAVKDVLKERQEN